MRDERDRPAGRWPWGLWLGLGSLSAGSVAAFAVSGWIFLAATDSYDGPLAVPEPDLSTERLVIESGPAAPADDAEEPEEEPAEEPTRPTPEGMSAARAVAEEVQEPPDVAAPAAPRTPVEPVEPVFEEPAPPVERAEPPVEERGELVPIEPDDHGCGEGDRGGDVGDGGGPRLVLEFEIRVPLSPKE